MNATVTFDTLYGLCNVTFANATACESARTAIGSIPAPLQNAICWTGHVVYGTGHSWLWMFQNAGYYGSYFNDYGGYIAQAGWLLLTAAVARAAMERIFVGRKQEVIKTETVVPLTHAQLETFLKTGRS